MLARITGPGGAMATVRRSLVVRPAGAPRSTSARADGRCRVTRPPLNSTLRFAVGRGGTLLRDLRASVTAFCIGPTLRDNQVRVAFADLPSARIDPPGRSPARSSCAAAAAG